LTKRNIPARRVNLGDDITLDGQTRAEELGFASRLIQQ
jgi:hypothetical protein